MSNIKEIKRKISSINSVSKTTEAMKMISISELKKYKNILINVTDYLNHIQSILKEIMSIVKKNSFFFILLKRIIKNYLFFLLLIKDYVVLLTFLFLIKLII